ncbi:MAG: hypothetical protein R8K22_03465 [Mariprofundaceae bacterium]
MSNLTGPWAGSIYGTNTGNIFVEFNQKDADLTGHLRISDNRFGISSYTFTGSENDQIVLMCSPEQIPDGIDAGEVTVKGQLQSDGTISGQWESLIGSAGTFRLWPHNVEVSQQETTEPEQVYNRTVDIGSVRILRDDIEGIFKHVQKDFVQGKLIVTYEQNGNEITKYADNFLQSIDQLLELKSIKLFIQEPEVAGINRSVNIDLLEGGGSAIRTSGVNESWVVGKAESLRRSLACFENNVVTNYRKYGLNFNSIIFLLMIAFVPEISTWPKRLLFVTAVVILLAILYSVYSKLIPNTLILLGERTTGFWARAWPSVLSWLLAATSALIAGWLLQVLAG